MTTENKRRINMKSENWVLIKWCKLEYSMNNWTRYESDDEMKLDLQRKKRKMIFTRRLECQKAGAKKKLDCEADANLLEPKFS